MIDELLVTWGVRPQRLRGAAEITVVEGCADKVPFRLTGKLEKLVIEGKAWQVGTLSALESP
jgi:hypothetical protein